LRTQLNLKHTGASLIYRRYGTSGFLPARKGHGKEITKMRFKPPVYFTALVLVLLCTTVWADQIILKNGTAYSGKFIRGDSKVVDFRILGRLESFQTSEISQIVFKEPELEATARASARAASPVRPEPEPAEVRPRPRVMQEAPLPKDSSNSALTIPAGMAITVRTATEIDTDRNRVGDAFDAVLDSDLMAGTQVAVPRGATVKGRIAYAQESGKLSGQSQLVLELTEMTTNGRTYPLRTSDYTEMGSSRGTRTAQTVGGTAALGAIIGAIAGGGKGAAIGAASGAAVGTGVQVVTKGQVLRVPVETILEFKLQSPLTIDTP
jgi:hypothetical protein